MVRHIPAADKVYQVAQVASNRVLQDHFGIMLDARSEVSTPQLWPMAIKTRLTYNCAHLRSTKETLTIEYFRIILEKKFG